MLFQADSIVIQVPTTTDWGSPLVIVPVIGVLSTLLLALAQLYTAEVRLKRQRQADLEARKEDSRERRAERADEEERRQTREAQERTRAAKDQALKPVYEFIEVCLGLQSTYRMGALTGPPLADDAVSEQVVADANRLGHAVTRAVGPLRIYDRSGKGEQLVMLIGPAVDSAMADWRTSRNTPTAQSEQILSWCTELQELYIEMTSV